MPSSTPESSTACLEAAAANRLWRPRLANSDSSSPESATARRATPRVKSLYSRDELKEIFRRFSIQRPEPKGELEHVNPFTLVVAVALSAQATDAGVNKATRALFAVADTPEKMLALGEEKLRDYIKTIGLYRNKAKNLIAMAKALLAEHGGNVPETREVLMSLPGVGRKTANVVLNTAFGQNTIGIDTHAFRVANRTGLAPGKTPLEVELKLEKIVPERYKHNCHHWLILHGRYVCKAKKPECWRCIIADICLFKPKTPAPAC